MTVSPSARRFDARLRLLVDVRRIVRALDASDAVTLLSLVFIFIGLSVPSAAFGVVGFLLLPLTPIWVGIRLLVRGR